MLIAIINIWIGLVNGIKTIWYSWIVREWLKATVILWFEGIPGVLITSALLQWVFRVSWADTIVPGHAIQVLGGLVSIAVIEYARPRW